MPVFMQILHQYPVSTRNAETVLAWYRASSKFPPGQLHNILLRHYPGGYPVLGVCMAPVLVRNALLQCVCVVQRYSRPVPNLYCQTTSALKCRTYPFCISTGLVLLRSWSQPFASTGSIVDYLYWPTVLRQYYACDELRRNTEISTWDIWRKVCVCMANVIFMRFFCGINKVREKQEDIFRLYF